VIKRIFSAMKCLRLVALLLPGIAAAGASQQATGLRAALDARIARAPARAVGLYYRSLARADSILIGANLRFHAASTMKLPVMIQIFRDADTGLLGLDDSLTVHTAFPSLVEGAFVVGKEDDSDSTLYALVGRNRAVRDLLERMITRSSNLATNILIERVGAARAQASARSCTTTPPSSFPPMGEATFWSCSPAASKRTASPTTWSRTCRAWYTTG